MRTFSSQFNRQFLIAQKGTLCANCGTECNNEIVFHHIVPIVLGGNDILTNIAPLCNDCHNLIHHGSHNNQILSHSDLIKAGIAKRKAQGLSVGRHTMTKKDIPQSFLDYYPKIKNNDITITQTARELNISRTTIYKYISLIEDISS